MLAGPRGCHRDLPVKFCRRDDDDRIHFGVGDQFFISRVDARDAEFFGRLVPVFLIGIREGHQAGFVDSESKVPAMNQPGAPGTEEADLDFRVVLFQRIILSFGVKVKPIHVIFNCKQQK